MKFAGDRLIARGLRVAPWSLTLHFLFFTLTTEKSGFSSFPVNLFSYMGFNLQNMLIRLGVPKVRAARGRQGGTQKAEWFSISFKFC